MSITWKSIISIIEDLFTKVKPIEKDFESLLVALETPLAKNQLSEVLSVYHEHLNHLKLDNLDLMISWLLLFEIPYPVLKKLDCKPSYSFGTKKVSQLGWMSMLMLILII